MKNPFKIDIPENRNFGLDLMRFMAIFTVMVSHSIINLPSQFYFVHHFIFDGVLLFFVLSGFLIGRIFIKQFESGFTRDKVFYFWQRRWLRTLPAYYFTIILILCLSYILNKNIPWTEVLKSLFFVQNIYEGPAFFGESWSLSIEEWFYLTLPVITFLFYFLFKISIRLNILITAIIIIVFSLFARYYSLYTNSINSITDWNFNIRSVIINRLDSILFGVLGAWFYYFKMEWFKKYKFHFLIVGLFIFLGNKIISDLDLLPLRSLYYGVFYFTTAPISFLLMLPFFFYLPKPKSKNLNDLIVTGSLISYSLYLLNATVISYIILNPLNINLNFKFLLFWILSIFGSIIVYKYIEIPFMKFRR